MKNIPLRVPVSVALAVRHQVPVWVLALPTVRPVRVPVPVPAALAVRHQVPVPAAPAVD